MKSLNFVDSSEVRLNNYEDSFKNVLPVLPNTITSLKKLEVRVPNKHSNSELIIPKRHKKIELQHGDASWYGRIFHGRTTANGETYDMYSMTAAHKSLPFNTKVRVKNKKTGQSVTVRINDRGPYIRGRIIDLSYKSARLLGIIEPGTASVSVAVLK